MRLDVRYRPYPVLPPENLKYEDEEAQRRGVIQWFYRAEGCPDPDSWDGAGGLCDRICHRMGLEPNAGKKLVKETLYKIIQGDDARDRAWHERALKLNPTEHFIVADCLRRGLGVIPSDG